MSNFLDDMSPDLIFETILLIKKSFINSNGFDMRFIQKYTFVSLGDVMIKYIEYGGQSIINVGPVSTCRLFIDSSLSLSTRHRALRKSMQSRFEFETL